MQAKLAVWTEFFEPLDAREIEMVSGLVQKQNVGIATSASASASRLRHPPDSAAASWSKS